MMPSWECFVCGHTVSGFEGEHGIYHGRCPTCGQGYGTYRTDEDRMASYEEHLRPLYAVCIEEARTGRHVYHIVRGWLDHITASLEVCDPGTVMTVYDTRTRRPVERMHARIGWNAIRTLGDVDWLKAHGGVA